MNDVLQRALHTLAYPTDDPNKTVLLVLAVVVFGVLVAVILMAIGSPRRESENESVTPDEPTPGDD